MKFEFPQSIKSDYNGYNTLVDFCNKTNDLHLDKITLDFGNTEWFEANLTAVLGAVLSNAQNNFNNIKIEGLSTKIATLFSRNHFLSHFGGLKIKDFNDTTIKYRKFKVTEEKLFKEYLDRELLSKEVMPKMSDLLKKKINESIFEIFNNAVIHGNCQNIFTSGQYYPNKNRLDFTIVNLGKTIKENVNEYLNKTLSGMDTIKWAVVEGNTTKRGPIPGGLGLSLIREFISKNNGKIQIVSADGYLEQINDIEKSESFPKVFKGTIVNLEFNTADTSNYCLVLEIDKENIF